MQLWITELSYGSAVTFLLMGFELGLYDPAEYGAAFWYCAFLLDQRRSLAQERLNARPKQATPAPGKKKAAGKKKGGKSKAAEGRKVLLSSGEQSPSWAFSFAALAAPHGVAPLYTGAAFVPCHMPWHCRMCPMYCESGNSHLKSSNARGHRSTRNVCMQRNWCACKWSMPT